MASSSNGSGVAGPRRRGRPNRGVIARRSVEYLANDVRRLVLGLVIRAYLQLREQAKRNELESAEDQQDAKQQQGAMEISQRFAAGFIPLVQEYARSPFAWLEAGLERPEILDRLEHAMQARREQGEPVELLEELLDGFSGWCAI